MFSIELNLLPVLKQKKIKIRRKYMPIFDYECPDCHEVFEKIYITMDEAKDSDVTECPECGCKEAKKLPSLFGKHVSWTMWNNLSN
jgi:putative FmdB family regulatory protein